MVSAVRSMPLGESAAVFAAPETSPLRSLSLGGNEFHRALDAPAADVRARRSRRKAERALARAQQAARHRKVVLRPHS